MKPSELSKLADLSKCYMLDWESRFVDWFRHPVFSPGVMNEYQRRELNSMWHKYRNQIKACKRNAK